MPLTARVTASRRVPSTARILGGCSITGRTREYLASFVESGGMSRSLSGFLVLALAANVLGQSGVPPRHAGSVTGATSQGARNVPGSGANRSRRPLTIIGAVAGDGDARVIWTPLLPPQSRASTRYDVISTPRAIGQPPTLHATTGVVRGLQNGPAYTFTVVAQTDDSAVRVMSAPSRPVVPHPAVRVDRGTLVDDAAVVTRLLGVNLSGPEYACRQPVGNSSAATRPGTSAPLPDLGPMLPAGQGPPVAAIVAWHATAVRLPLNE